MSTNYCDEQFDAEFRSVAALKWLPWVGDTYRASHDKLIILGESHYDWQDPADTASSSKEMLNDKFFTRGIVVGHGLSCSPAWKMQRNLERVVFGEKHPTDENKKALWRAVCYHNLILRNMTDKKARPVWNDYVAGWKVFFDLVGVLNPTHCLFAGTDSQKLKSFKEVASSQRAETSGESWSEKISGAYGKKVDVKSDGVSFRLVFMMHPSSRNFSWCKWSPFIRQFMPNPLGEVAR